jgi:hypothetical protein
MSMTQNHMGRDILEKTEPFISETISGFKERENVVLGFNGGNEVSIASV